MLALSPCSSRPAGEQLVKTDQVVDQPDGIPQHPDRLPGCHFEGVSGRFCLFASPPPKRTTPREVWEVVEKMVVAPSGHTAQPGRSSGLLAGHIDINLVIRRPACQDGTQASSRAPGSPREDRRQVCSRQALCQESTARPWAWHPQLPSGIQPSARRSTTGPETQTRAPDWYEEEALARSTAHTG
jgi:hypothetical protein